MELRNFSLGRYSDAEFVIKSAEKKEYALLTNYQNYLFEQITAKKQALFVLFSPVGVQTVAHCKLFFELIRRLVDMGLVANVKPGEGDRQISRIPEAGRYEGMFTLAKVVCAAWSKLFGKVSPAALVVTLTFLACFGLASYAWLYELVAQTQSLQSFPFLKATLISYVMICLSLSWRALVQVSFLKAHGREPLRERFEFVGPFIILAIDTRDIWLEGLGARLFLAFLGLLAPLSLLGMLALFNLLTTVTPFSVMLCAFPCLVASLLLACPLHNFEGSELVHGYLGAGLNTRLFEDLGKNSFWKDRRKVIIFVLAVALWSFVWSDVWRAFWQLSLSTLVEQLYFDFDPGFLFFIKLGQGLLYLTIAYPLFLISYHLIQYWMGKKSVENSVLQIHRQPLTFQEQSFALSQVPLFVSLPENEATQLFKRMDTRFFADGEALVRQGEAGDEFFVLVRGRAKAEFVDSVGKKRVVGLLQEGDAFGEVALIDNVPRTASVISIGGCFAVSLKKAAFREFIEKSSSPTSIKQTIRLSSFLKKHPLFSRLDAEDLAKTLSLFSYESIGPRGEISSSALLENFYIIYSGRVHVDTGDDRTDFVLGPEDCLGFSPGSDGVRGTVRAVDGAGVLRLSKHDFLENVWEKFLQRPELLWAKK